MAASNKPAYSISDQIQLLKSRGMTFRNEKAAENTLYNISYYRLKGYWWDLQDDRVKHIFSPSTIFEDIIDRYNFDRELRTILFEAIERIEIALRTKLIHELSISYGGLWYKEAKLFSDSSTHADTIKELTKEFDRSQEIFIKDQRNRHPGTDADAWKILEVASMGTLSKLYKNLLPQLPEKAIIAQAMGLNLHSELASWLEAISYIRNIVAHHSRLWSRNMVKRPIVRLVNPKGLWLSELTDVQQKKPFLIISCLVYLCDAISPGHIVKTNIIDLINSSPHIPIYKMGFLNKWQQQPLWK